MSVWITYNKALLAQSSKVCMWPEITPACCLCRAQALTPYPWFIQLAWGPPQVTKKTSALERSPGNRKMSYYLPIWIYACACVFNKEPGACWTPEAGIYTGQHLAAAVYLECKNNKLSWQDDVCKASSPPTACGRGVWFAGSPIIKWLALRHYQYQIA